MKRFFLIAALMLSASLTYGAFSATTKWEVETGASDVNNGGGFDEGATGFPTDGKALFATTTAPQFFSATYSFVASDVGAWIYEKSCASGCLPGLYQITAVVSGTATVNATPAQYVSYTTVPSTVTGMGTASSLTSVTWGINYSLSPTTQTAYTDLAIDAAVNTKARSAASPFGVNAVGNIVAITGGTGFTVQRAAIYSVVAATATFEKSLGTLASTGGTGNLGGAFNSPAMPAGIKVSNNPVYIKTGVYLATTTTVNVSSGVISDAAGGANIWEGYSIVRGDMGSPPTIRALGISSTNLYLMASSAGNVWRNITLDGAGLSTILCFNAGGRRSLIQQSNVINCSNGAISGSLTVVDRVFVTNTTGATAAVTAQSIYNSVVSSGTNVGIASGYVVGNLVYGCSGATSDGINLNTDGFATNNTVVKNGRDGIRYVGTEAGLIANNIAESNTGFGISGSAVAPNVILDRNATFNNTSGPVNFTNLTGDNFNLLQGGSSFFVNASTVTGTNFALNTNTGSGLSARGYGFPGLSTDGTTTGYLDIGAFQHKDPTTGRAWIQ